MEKQIEYNPQVRIDYDGARIDQRYMAHYTLGQQRFLCYLHIVVVAGTETERFVQWGELGQGAPVNRTQAEDEIWEQFADDALTPVLVERLQWEVARLEDYVAYVALCAKMEQVPVTLAEWEAPHTSHDQLLLDLLS